MGCACLQRCHTPIYRRIPHHIPHQHLQLRNLGVQKTQLIVQMMSVSIKLFISCSCLTCLISEFAFEIGSSLLTEVRRLQSLLAERDKAIQEMKEEKECFQILKDIDHVSGRVQGSLTSKKYMRNEI